MSGKLYIDASIFFLGIVILTQGSLLSNCVVLVFVKKFAVVFAALVHDVDHPGVSNMQLVKEETRLAKVYDNKSISEQNSFDIAWRLLMEPSYQNLLKCICSSQDEIKRFRQLMVHLIMSTDISCADLRSDRNSRWDLAFAKKKGGDAVATSDSIREDRNRKATIVLVSAQKHVMKHATQLKQSLLTRVFRLLNRNITLCRSTYYKHRIFHTQCNTS